MNSTNVDIGSQGSDPRNLPTMVTPLPRTGMRGLLKLLGNPDSYGNPPIPYTGRLTLIDETNTRTGHIYMRNGRVYAIHYTDFIPPLARRLHTNQYITAEQYTTLVQSGTPDDETTIRTLLEVSNETIENINRQMLLSSLAHLYSWNEAAWLWEQDAHTALNTISPLEPTLLVAAADERDGQWNALQRNYVEATESDAIPIRGKEWAEIPPDYLSPEGQAIQSLVDNQKTNRIIAGTLGLTRFELAGRLAQAIADETIQYAAPEDLPDVDGTNFFNEQSNRLDTLAAERGTLNARLREIDAEIAKINREKLL